MRQTTTAVSLQVFCPGTQTAQTPAPMQTEASPAQLLFHFAWLSGIDLSICAGAGLICFVGLEGVKWLWFRRRLGNQPA